VVVRINDRGPFAPVAGHRSEPGGGAGDRCQRGCVSFIVGWWRLEFVDFDRLPRSPLARAKLGYVCRTTILFFNKIKH
jgi:hypothetical protein